MTLASLKVLHIDDDAALARLVQKALGRRGFAVESVRDLPEGLERMAAGDIDVVVLDHYLASGTGISMIEMMKAKKFSPRRSARGSLPIPTSPFS